MLGTLLKQPQEAVGSGLFFVFDAPYLPAFQVLAYSLAATKSLLNLPVTIVTTDEEVAGDPVVAACADHVRVLSSRDLAEFRAIDRGDIRPYLRHELVPKYSFLKWLVFEDYGFEQHIYLDVDMVALADCSELAVAHHDVDIAAASRSPKLLRRNHGDKLPRKIVEQNIREFFEGSRKWSYGINSGVLVLGSKMMKPDVRQELLAIRAENGFTFDQKTLNSWVESSDDIESRWLEPTWNVNHRMLGSVPLLLQMEILSRTRFLHFISSKPWIEADPDRFTDRMWLGMARDAKRFYQDLGLATAIAL